MPSVTDIAVLSDENSFMDYLQRAAVVSIIEKALTDAGFNDVGAVYQNDEPRIPTEAILTVFDVATWFYPHLLDRPITISQQGRVRSIRDVGLNEAEADLIVEHLHRAADKAAKLAMRSKTPNFPL